MTDARPLHDPNYVKERLREIFRYLVAHNYPLPVSVSQLQTPARPELWSVTSWLLKALHSERTVRTLQELSTVAREVGYPYPVQQGTPACNLQSALGFCFWVFEVLRLCEPTEQCPDQVSEHLLSCYVTYMAQGTSSEIEHQRSSFLQDIAEEGNQLAEHKAKLQKELAKLEERNRASPVRVEAERLAAQNQSYLTQILAPLEEQRNQLRASLVTPPSLQALKEQLRVTQSSARALEQQYRDLSEDKSTQEEALRAAGLGKAERRALPQRLEKLHDEVQELEYEDFRLRSEADLLKDRQLSALSESALKEQAQVQARELQAARELLKKDFAAIQKLGQL